MFCACAPGCPVSRDPTPEPAGKGAGDLFGCRSLCGGRTGRLEPVLSPEQFGPPSELSLAAQALVDRVRSGAWRPPARSRTPAARLADVLSRSIVGSRTQPELSALYRRSQNRRFGPVSRCRICRSLPAGPPRSHWREPGNITRCHVQQGAHPGRRPVEHFVQPVQS
jgi:hypothetical protein